MKKTWKAGLRHVWVVEVDFSRDQSWAPTVGVGLTRDDAMAAIADWRKRLPDDKFRLQKYVREVS